MYFQVSHRQIKSSKYAVLSLGMCNSLKQLKPAFQTELTSLQIIKFMYVSVVLFCFVVFWILCCVVCEKIK